MPSMEKVKTSFPLISTFLNLNKIICKHVRYVIIYMVWPAAALLSIGGRGGGVACVV
jgi:hypothetical protein